MLAQISLHLLKTQNLAALYKAQMEDSSLIGTVVVRPDAITTPLYQILNCAIQSIAELRMNGRDAGFRVTIGGFYSINGSLFDGA